MHKCLRETVFWQGYRNSRSHAPHGNVVKVRCTASHGQRLHIRDSHAERDLQSRPKRLMDLRESGSWSFQDCISKLELGNGLMGIA